ncbi:hypothetical protein OSB04_022338 [Centaurea solstitialis]|uniref:Uncharacterized protein n=1 Tax=Centaurea solstitialis TaxID=347529 RepID=A0AA38SVZ0_9ASTR|nr:hypothetical protein OSB04_022338 [Centaurea solstitialis]
MSSFDFYSDMCFKAAMKLLNDGSYFFQNQYNVTITQEYDLESCVTLTGYIDLFNKYSGPTVWVGIYIAIASAFCILAMAADLFHGFRNRKFWFPCKYFSLNAASLTVIAVAMKLPVDLTSPMLGYVDQAAKLGSMAFMCMMMANLMPSLASMDNKTLLANIIGLSILVITIIVNISIEINTGVIMYGHFSFLSAMSNIQNTMVLACIYTVLMLLLLLILISSAITVPTSKQILKFKYQATSKTILDDQRTRMSTLEKLRQYVRQYWVMAKSGNPQFAMAGNPLSNASAIICVITLLTYVPVPVYIVFSGDDHQSEYKWSMVVIVIIQSIGVLVGCIAPIFRCFTHLRFKLFARNHLMIFKVEKYWTQKLCEWKESRLLFLSNAGKSRAIVYNLKNLILSICIGFQVVVVVSCKMIGIIHIVLVIFLVCCSYCWKSLKALLVTIPIASSTSDDTNDDLSSYVLQIQDEKEFAKITVKDISNSMNRLIQKLKKEQHNDLLELLGKSTGFEGVEKFDNNQVQSLVPIEFVNSWSLPVVTLTCIAVALPNIRKDKVESLLKGVRDGLSYTHFVEESLNSASEYVNVRKATLHLWHEVEDNYKWLGNALDRNAFKRKTSSEILEWFVEKAREIVIEIKENLNGEVTESFPNKLIVANSMYRIAGTILLHNQSSIEPISKKQLFTLLSCMISDILSACLTNIPRAIETICRESVTIQKQETSIEAAAKLLGRSTEIIEKLEACELPNVDPDKMAFIDEWRLHLKQLENQSNEPKEVITNWVIGIFMQIENNFKSKPQQLFYIIRKPFNNCWASELYKRLSVSKPQQLFYIIRKPFNNCWASELYKRLSVSKPQQLSYIIRKPFNNCWASELYKRLSVSTFQTSTNELGTIPSPNPCLHFLIVPIMRFLGRAVHAIQVSTLKFTPQASFYLSKNILIMSAYDSYSNDCFKVVHKLYDASYSIQEQYTVNITKDDISSFVSCFVVEELMEVYNIYSGPMVWIGIYIAIASVFCILAMVADLFYGIRNRKLWFPCKYFSLNAASITVVAVAMKLPVDLSSSMPGEVDQAAKLGSLAFMCIMIANLMPSLASMDNKTLLANTIGLAILIITMIVNILIQIITGVIANGYFMMWACIYMVLMLSLLFILISSAITIPTSKRILESKYLATSKKTLNEQHIGISMEEKLRQYVRRYWVMAESGNPQFVMASNSLSNASGIICVVSLVTYVFRVLDIFGIPANEYKSKYLYQTKYQSEYQSGFRSEYKWSMVVILVTQFIGVVVGSIAPTFRCFTVFRFKLLTWDHFLVFKVEKYWTKMLYEWKENRLPFLSNGRRTRAFKVVVVSCKIIGIIRIVLIFFVLCCSYGWRSLKTRLFITPIASSVDDIKDLSDYVLEIQDGMEFAEMTVKGISNSMNRLIQKVNMEQHNDLLELLGTSTDFEGVEKFDIDQVQPLLCVEPVNSWSLPIVTLTCIAVSLPNIQKDRVERLFKGVGNGLSYTHLVEESLNCGSEYVNVGRATMNLWHEIEDKYKWLGNTLERNAKKGKTSMEILQWFAHKARVIVIEIKENTKDELLESFPSNLIVANSMYRVAQTILLTYQSNIESISEERLFDLLCCMISDIFSACFTNIPRVIAKNCHESVIEKREASVEAATKLLGRSTEIINNLEACELPRIDQEKMAFIDEWRSHLKRQLRGKVLHSMINDLSTTRSNVSSNLGKVLSKMELVAEEQDRVIPIGILMSSSSTVVISSLKTIPSTLLFASSSRARMTSFRGLFVILFQKFPHGIGVPTSGISFPFYQLSLSFTPLIPGHICGAISTRWNQKPFEGGNAKKKKVQSRQRRQAELKDKDHAVSPKKLSSKHWLQERWIVSKEVRRLMSFRGRNI